MRTHLSCVVAGAIAGTFFHQIARADTITLNVGGTTDLQEVARDSTGNPSLINDIEHLFPTSLPFNGSQTASQGASSSTATYSLSQTDFSITSSGARAGAIDSRANVQPTIFFSVSADTAYTISGSLSVNDLGSSGRFVSLQAALKDVGTSAVLFNSDQESFSAPDQTFQLGGAAGNSVNVLSGSATGVLLAGHEYSLFYGSSIYSNDAGDPASFTGSFDFKLGPQNSVPDGGATAWLLAASLFGVGWLRRLARPE